jgi:hypothetical protein
MRGHQLETVLNHGAAGNLARVREVGGTVRTDGGSTA